MADLTITAASVQPLAGATTINVTYGEAVTQGQVVRDGGDGEYYLADNDATDEDVAAGIAITPGGDGEFGIIATAGPVDVGAPLTVGTIYCLSDTPGGICPSTDLANPQKVTILGVATAAGSLDLDINVSGATVPV